jgi:hypothetical protein
VAGAAIERKVDVARDMQRAEAAVEALDFERGHDCLKDANGLARSQHLRNIFTLRMTFFENRFPLFGVMR